MASAAFLTATPLTLTQTRFTAVEAHPTVYKATQHRPATMMNAKPEDHDPDDDDASFGKMDATDCYAMQMPPNLSETDKDYLDAAKNGDEFLARLAEITRRKDLENRRASGRKLYTQTSDYFSQLSKKEE